MQNNSVSDTENPEDRKHSVTVSRRHTTMSEHIATYPLLAQWSSLPLAFVSRSVGVVSGLAAVFFVLLFLCRRAALLGVFPAAVFPVFALSGFSGFSLSEVIRAGLMH